MADEVIEVEHVSKDFGDTKGVNVQAVRNVSFSVQQGQALAIIGPNGAGKSTLIKMLVGLIRPTMGTIRICGYCFDKNEYRLRKEVGYIPEAVSLYRRLTVWETMRFFGRINGMGRNRCREVLDKVNLHDAAERKVGELSKGMLQRLGLAQSILKKSSILILDEPASGLDPDGTHELTGLLRVLAHEGVTIVFASHFLSEVHTLTDSVAIFDAGELISKGTPSELRQTLGLMPRMEIILREMKPEFLTCVKEEAGTEKATADGNVLSLTCFREQKYSVLRKLEQADADIVDVHTVEPSLEQIYVGYLKKWRQEEES